MSRYVKDRTLYYVCRAVSRQIESPSSKEVPVPEDPMIAREPLVAYGKQYRLPTIYGIFLMNFKEENLEAKFRTDTVLSDRDTGKIINPHLRQIYLQFPYFTKELSDCHTLYDKLIYALKNMSNWNRMPDALKEQVFEHLARLAAVADLSEENRIAYDKALDRYRVNLIAEEDERRRNEEMRRKAAEEGMKEGRKEGRKEGLKEGLEKGEKKKQLEIACNLKKAGISIEVIAVSTGLTIEEIETI